MLQPFVPIHTAHLSKTAEVNLSVRLELLRPARKFVMTCGVVAVIGCDIVGIGTGVGMGVG